MKALLRKDLYVLCRQMLVFILMIVVFCATPLFAGTFGITYSAMIPYTTIAYDERSKWDRLAAMMPYTAREVVLSKYVLGWCFTLGSTLLSVPFQYLASLLALRPFSLVPMLTAACCAVIILSISLPFIFRFGVERGRMATILTIFLICFSGAFTETLSTVVTRNGGVPLLPAAVLAVGMSALSVSLSLRFYKRSH